MDLMKTSQNPDDLENIWLKWRQAMNSEEMCQKFVSLLTVSEKVANLNGTFKS